MFRITLKKKQETVRTKGSQGAMIKQKRIKPEDSSQDNMVSHSHDRNRNHKKRGHKYWLYPDIRDDQNAMGGAGNHWFG